MLDGRIPVTIRSGVPGLLRSRGWLSAPTGAMRLRCDDGERPTRLPHGGDPQR